LGSVKTIAKSMAPGDYSCTRRYNASRVPLSPSSAGPAASAPQPRCDAPPPPPPPAPPLQAAAAPPPWPRRCARAAAPPPGRRRRPWEHGERVIVVGANGWAASRARPQIYRTSTECSFFLYFTLHVIDLIENVNYDFGNQRDSPLLKEDTLSIFDSIYTSCINRG
jgi:hypothetical protein